MSVDNTIESALEKSGAVALETEIVPQLGARAMERRDVLRKLTLSMSFAAGFSTIIGALMTRYGQSLGVTPFGFGVLAAVPFITALSQLPGSWFIERYGYRKTVCLSCGLANRLTWLAIAAIPWALPQRRWWLAFIALYAFSSFVSQVPAPGGTAWMADLIPSMIRGRYLAFRALAGQVVVVPLGLLVGYALDHPRSAGMSGLQKTISTWLVAAAVLGVIEVLLWLRIPDAQDRPKTGELGVWPMLRRPLTDRRFLCYIGYMGTMTFATGYIGTFCWLYLLDVVKVTNTEATLMCMVIPTVVGIVAMRLWGRLIDRWGWRRVLVIAAVLVINGATAWTFVTAESKWTWYPLVLISTLGWTAVNLCTSVFIMNLSQSRDGSYAGSSYVAVGSVATALAGAVSGLFGGYIARTFEAWHGSLFGLPLTFHHILFFISACFRFTAMLWLPGLCRKEKA